MQKRLLVIYFLITIILLLYGSASCSPSDQRQLQTAIAPVVSTAESDARKYAQTQAVKMEKTAIAYAGTEAVNLQKTAIAAASTKVSEILTPRPPKTDYQINSRDIILYNLVREINLSEVAFMFSIPSDQLITLNKGRYPSITSEQSKLQPDWRLVLYLGSPEHAELIPENENTWDNISGCIQNQTPMISVITCNEYTLDFVSEKGMNFGCISLDSNPLGYYMVHSRYQGLMLFYAGEPFIYSLYYDEEKDSIIIGPAIIKSKLNLPECGIPGNP
jgi:hypothetical protein